VFNKELGGGECLTRSFNLQSFHTSLQLFKRETIKSYNSIPVLVCYDADHGVMVLLFQLDQTKH